MTIDKKVPWFQGMVLEFMRDQADSAIGRNAWDDEPPRLWLMAKQPRWEGDKVAVAELPVPEELWIAAPPAAVLPALAQGARSNPDLMTPEARADLHGIVMLAETWDLAIPPGTPFHEQDQAYAFCQNHSISEHPWGVEAKTMFAVDTDGWDLFLSRRRGGEPGPEWASAPGENEATGRIPDGLNELLDALRGEQ